MRMIWSRCALHGNKRVVARIHFCVFSVCILSTYHYILLVSEQKFAYDHEFYYVYVIQLSRVV